MKEPADYQVLKPIFHHALDLPPAEREAYLREACGDDAALRAEIDSLLAAADDDSPCLIDRSGHADAPLDLDALGRDRGWRVLREIARGGMGVVYLVERIDGSYRQRAALKLLQPGARPDAEAVLRLKLERQILARLDHPNIARLIDGGTTAEGAPYFVMDYVDGQPLHHWCRHHQLDIDARLRLFLKVCDAVVYAHRNLVIHRDLKPSNILVDANGEPKLLDFGIARLLEGDATLTADGQRLLTPRFASPEQFRGEAVSTQSDVYSLGVLLFELLTGSSPYGNAASQPHRLPQAICDTEPSRPSDSLERSGDADADAATPARRLRGDLDAIVLRCLRKQPADRYASVEALAADIEAHLDGLPVQARHGERMYRVRRLARRHWPALATVAGVLLLSLLFVLQLQQRLIAERQQRERGDQVTGFMIGLFREVDPRQARGSEPTVRDALARGVARLDSELAAQPALRGELLRAIASIHLELGDLERAEQLAEQALALVDSERADAVGEARYVLADAYRQRGRNEEAAALLRSALADGRGRVDDLRLRSLNLLGVVEGNLEHREAALDLHQQAIDEALAWLGAGSLEAAIDAGEQPAARLEVLQSLTLAWHNRCSALQALGRYEAAIADCERALRAKQRLWPPDHPLQLTTLNLLASVREDKGGPELAIPTGREVLALTERIYGPHHVRTATVAVNLGVSIKTLGGFEEAAGLYRRALAVFEAQLGPNHRATLTTRNNLGNLELQRAVRTEEAGDSANALAIKREVLTMQSETLARRREALGDSHVDVAQSLMNLANIQKELGMIDAAVDSARQAHALYLAELGPEHPTTVLMTHSLAQKLLTAGAYAESLALSEQALQTYTAADINPAAQASVRFTAARALWQLGSDPERARELGREALAGAREHPEHELLSVGEIEEWLQAVGGTP